MMTIFKKQKLEKQNIIDIENGNVTIQSDIILKPQTSLTEFISMAKQYLQLNVVNIPHRSYIINTEKLDFYVYFYSDTICQISIVIVPYKNSTFNAVKEILKEVTTTDVQYFSWGYIFACDNRLDGIASIKICFSDLQQPANETFPPVQLIPMAINKEAEDFINKTFTDKISRIGTAYPSNDPRWSWPEWLNWNHGPICKQCGKEMIFYSRIALPSSIKRKYIDTFFCSKCLEGASIMTD